jgi:hypothetical protein
MLVAQLNEPELLHKPPLIMMLLMQLREMNWTRAPTRSALVKIGGSSALLGNAATFVDFTATLMP